MQIKTKIFKYGCFIGLWFSASAVAQNAIPVIPIVPAQQAKADLPKPLSHTTKAQKKRAQANKKNTGTRAHKAAGSSRNSIIMQPGVNEIVQVAVNHLNRIVTPYSHPKIRTSSPSTTEIHDNVIYIGSDNESPITLFIIDQDNEEQALSLTLIPRKIPPREIFLSLQGKPGITGSTKATKMAKKWESSQPYIATLEDLFRTLALGQLPPGYNLQKQAVGNLPYCRQTGLQFEFARGQTIVGHHLMVHIGIAHNAAPYPIEFIEDTCGDWDIAAVTAFPRHILNPGEKTEVYVAQKRNYTREIEVKRPSLLLGGK
ncbi:MAG: type-F conjugative transfer system secretin TraK [Cellvibrionaceae bacterium]|nr:type-F conjugative transfer system secretin TraK [Cellvibrionaceae bacterium]